MPWQQTLESSVLSPRFSVKYNLCVTTRTEDLPTLLARIEDPAIRSLFSPEFVLCAEHFDRFTVDMVLRTVHELDLEPLLARGTSVREAVATKGWAPRAAIPLEWFFRKLAAEEYLSAEPGSGERRFRARGPLPEGDPDRAESLARAVDPRSVPPFTIVRAMIEHVPAFLRGEKTGEEILFAPAKLGLWFEYFSNDNLLYAINNRLGAEAVIRALPATRPATVVEIGGGSGSAALALAERLARDAALTRIALYRFSEIVPTFLRRAERAIRSRFPDLAIEFSRVDMDRDLEEQGIPKEEADVFYAVNTVHIAKDLGETLTRVREALRPGGAAVFSECVRPFEGQPIYVEFVFNFLENFTGVATDPATRPNHGFLTPENWRRALDKAGFERVEILPDVERLARHYDAFFVAAVTARRPR
jgi:SAM-dependent methyltransferase